MTTPTEKIYGYYDRADQPIDQPTLNPDEHGPCLICDKPITDEDVRTISLMPIGGTRSFFYRVHRTCHSTATAELQQQIDQIVIDQIDHYNDGFTTPAIID